MAAVPQVCAAANWHRHNHGNVVAMSMNPVAERSSSTPRIIPISGLQECPRQSRVNVLVASVVSVSVCVSLSFQAGFAVAASDNVPSNGRFSFPWEQVKPEQDEPKQGTCSTCIGVVDDTLGSCSATTNCVSSFDDRPKFFVAPWEFPGGLKAAVSNLQEALVRSGATIKEKSERYIYAVFTGEDGVSDDVEFLFSDPSVDATVNVRSASRATDYKDSGRNGKRLETLRMDLGWEQVPILRNRQRRLFFIESPWDTFGPEPPPTFDYKGGVEFVPD
ncbi:hypothetical protein M758_1G100300 [Ceratodon purpureus]|uniref:Uncharacterized protein n=1 Tax=Ceratodon purpureus TaxID=3225 RepID=A0A8T0J5X4_CERPU|nr:hypothetical protein KC19_1G111100 [Ceratodon purpureus]KAG0629393.1 hypothetical protein M758_1G100300 [Ceratodon purpureus]